MHITYISKEEKYVFMNKTYPLGASRGVVISAGAQHTEALALNAVFMSLSPILSNLCHMSFPFQIKGHNGLKTLRKKK